MRKLPIKYENPIDNIIYLFVKPHSNLLDCFSPNFITTISFIFALLCLYNYIEKKYELAALFYLISYFYDCVDGYHARRKNMITTFGDYYDHLTDIILNVGIYYLIINNFKNTQYFYPILITMIILFIGMYYHFGCQEHYYGKKEEVSPILNLFGLCKKNPEKQLVFSRYLGSGTFVFITIIIILFTNNL